jgi:Ca2+-binding RTX toxin-like protein
MMADDITPVDMATGAASSLMDTLAAFAEEAGGDGSMVTSTMFRLSSVTIELIPALSKEGTASDKSLAASRVFTTYLVSEFYAAGTLAALGAKYGGNNWEGKVVAAVIGAIAGYAIGGIFDRLVEVKQDGIVIARYGTGKTLEITPEDTLVFKDIDSNRSITFSVDPLGKLEYFKLSNVSDSKGYRLDADGTIAAYDNDQGILAVGNLHDEAMSPNIKLVIDDISMEIDRNLSEKLDGMTTDRLLYGDILPNDISGYNNIVTDNLLLSDGEGIAISPDGSVTINTKGTTIIKYPDGSGLATYYDPATGKAPVLVTTSGGKYIFYYPDSNSPSGLTPIEFSDPSELPLSIRGQFDGFVNHVAGSLQDGFTNLPEGTLPRVMDALPDPLDDLLSPPLGMPVGDQRLPRGIPEWMDKLGDLFDQAETATGSPLVIDLDGDGVELVAMTGAQAVYWDIDQDGFRERSGWVGKDDGLLVLDANGNGIVDGHAELFGDTQGDGFTELRTIDSTGNNAITANDQQWANLRVWKDANGDGVSQPGELLTMEQAGITRIYLDRVTGVSYDIAGNPISHESLVGFADGSKRKIVDAWFAYDNVNTVYDGVYTLDPRVLFLPTLRGYGTLPDLHIAMSRDETLLTMAVAIASASIDQVKDPAFNFYGKVHDLLLRWAGVDGIDPASRGPFVDARELALLEKLQDTSFYSQFGGPIPNTFAAPLIKQAVFDAVGAVAMRLLAQTEAGHTLSETASYDYIHDTVFGLPDMMRFSAYGWDTSELFIMALTGATSHLSMWDGDDVAYGTAGRDMISGNDGNDIIHGEDENDALYGDSGNDQLYGGNGADYLSGDYSSGSLSIEGDDLLYGGAGNDQLWSSGGNDSLFGDDGNDYLYAGTGNDYLRGGAGDDSLSGDTGDDTFVFDSGYDTIDDSDGIDTILLPAGISYADLSFGRVSSGSKVSLLITVGSLGALELGWQQTPTSTQPTPYRIEYLTFADGTSIDLMTHNFTQRGTAANEGLQGFEATGGKNDTLYGLEGNDYLYGYSGDDVLVGGAGNDTLDGGTGNDTFVYGGGMDQASEWNGGGVDTIQLESGVDFEALSIAQVSFDLKLILTPSIDELKVPYQFYGSMAAPIETLRLADGFTLDLLSFPNWVFTPGAGGTTSGDAGGAKADTIIGRAGVDTIRGYEMNDAIHAGAGNDTVYGGNGDDQLHGGSGNDKLYGEAGNDSLYGGVGDDTYYYTGGGLDRIIEADGADTLKLATGSDLGVLTFAATGTDDLTIIRKAGSQEVTLVHQMGADAAAKVETLSLVDGFTVDLTRFAEWRFAEAAGQTLTGGDAMDILIGRNGVDTLNGGNLADTIHGGAGNDQIFGGSGADLLHGGDGNDMLDGGSWGDKMWGGLGDDTLLGGIGTDTIQGNEGADLIESGQGADVLTGGAGADTFQYLVASLPAGTDKITDFSVADGDRLDIVDLLVGYDPLQDAITDFVTFTASGADTILSVDRDGTASSTYAAQQVALLQGVSGLNAETLETAGLLIAA